VAGACRLTVGDPHVQAYRRAAWQGADLDQVAANVTGGVVPASGHWVMEENPQATTKLVVDFLSK